MAKSGSSWFEIPALKVESGTSSTRFAIRVWHILSRAVENFISNNDLLRASALTYTAALSLVPILALAFSVVKSFGGAERLRDVVAQYLAIGGTNTSSQLMSYIENVNAAALGSAGGAILLITVISTMSTVEQAFNTIFNVPQSRSYFRKFSDYLSVLFTVPLLIVAALGLTAVFSVRMAQLSFLTQLAPYLFAWMGFFFLFVFFPYTKVKYSAALIGSLVTAILFQVAQWGYVRFQVGVASYRAIYGALATLPVFLVWIYVAWGVILFGAELTAAIQRGDSLPMLGPDSPDFQFGAVLHVLVRLADRAAHGGEPITSWTLARELSVAEATVAPIIDRLKEGDFIVEADSSASARNQGLFLAREPHAIVLDEAIGAIIHDQGATDTDPRVSGVLAKLSAARRGVLESITLEDIRTKIPADDDSLSGQAPAGIPEDGK